MAERADETSELPPRRARRVLDLIALFKFVKATVLVASGGAALGLSSPRVEQWAEALLERLALRHGSESIGRIADHAISVLDTTAPHRLILAALGAFLYAAIFVVEGIGLIRARRWAEYLTVIVTGSFLPFEIVALVHHATAPRVATLAANVAVVVYLVWRLYEDRPRTLESA